MIRSHKTKKSGTTLLELAVVLGLISIIVLLSSNYILVTKRLLIKAEVERLYSAFVTLQRNAMLEHKEQELVLDSQNSLYIFRSRSISLGKFIKFGAPANIKGPPSNPQKLITKPITFENSKITFYPDGQIDPGICYITDIDNSLTYAISVGVSDYPYIRKYVYKNNGWVILR